MYAALSYSWSAGGDSHKIYLHPMGNSKNNRPLPILIKNNLFCGLHRLRRANEDVILWVDALCINQADIEEKNQQLQQMVDIYGRAQRVCIWLGESDDRGHSDRAMDFIPDIVDMAT